MRVDTGSSALPSAGSSGRPTTTTASGDALPSVGSGGKGGACGGAIPSHPLIPAPSPLRANDSDGGWQCALICSAESGGRGGGMLRQNRSGGFVPSPPPPRPIPSVSRQRRWRMALRSPSLDLAGGQAARRRVRRRMRMRRRCPLSPFSSRSPHYCEPTMKTAGGGALASAGSGGR
uniref:Uncharacterized protein n=1 Tax=Oryza sativa subsp. japonica TaxID=39947 RepID=Q6Z163_ORYSJ|nr:hypothetical protein [Oryza sativa Japonica Group]BAD31902.1 hypothetical protein [Oryza sativa Japonica Group]